MELSVFFQGGQGLLRVLVVGTASYLGLVILLRLSGKRTLAQMNAYDLAVTVAIGSILATTLLSKQVALAEGLSALGLLIGLQYALAWLATRSRRVAAWISAEPTLLVFEGQYLSNAIRQQRVTEAEILSALRKQGLSSLAEAQAVVLESNGSLTVVFRPSPDQSDTALEPLRQQVDRA